MGDSLTDRAHVAAALLQHRVAVAVAEELVDRSWTRKDLADDMGVSAGTLGKLLRGHSVMSFTDLFKLVLHIGRVDLLPAPANLDEVLP